MADTTAGTENRVGFFTKIAAWIAGFGGKGVTIQEEELRIETDVILTILPHRGRWRLIDCVVITPQKVTGFFTMTKEICEGHGIGDNIVFPGALLAEMANQLLGVWFATQHPELIGAGKTFFARSGGYKASTFIYPGDLVRIETSHADLSGLTKTTRRGTMTDLIGKNFVIMVGPVLKGSVPYVEIKGVELPKITPKA